MRIGRDAGEIRALMASLREAGERMRRGRSPQAVRATLARWLDAFHPADSPWRARLQAALSEATGFHPETVREGLARGLGPFRGEALLSLCHRELETARDLAGWSGFPLCAQVLAGAIPMPTFQALALPLALGSPVLAKPASRDRASAAVWIEALEALDPELAGCVGLALFDASDGECAAALCAAECVVVTGGDESVAALAARVAPPRRFVGYGHHLSVAVVAGDLVGEDPALDRLARDLALDVALWDQLGCLSPVSVHVVGGGPHAAGRLAGALAGALEAAEKRWPRGALDPAAAGRFEDERSQAELRLAAGRGGAVFGRPGDPFAVVCEGDAGPRPSPLHRFVRVHPVGGLDALLVALEPLGPHLAGVALAAPGSAWWPWAQRLAGLGPSRICPPGRLQAPPFDWPHDNRGLLRPLARACRFEAPPG